MTRRIHVTLAAVLLLFGSGCIVTRSSYEMKAREADSLRSALADLNRDKTKLLGENQALAKQLAEKTDSEAALSRQVAEMDDSLKRLGEGLPGNRKPFESNAITRDRFIDELLERERETGLRIQELSSRAEGYEKDTERMRREMADRDREVAELRGKLAALVPLEEKLQRERSILSGRVERIQEERRSDMLHTGERFAALSADLGKVSPDIEVTSLGSALRIVVPEALVLRNPGGKITRMGRSIIAKVSGAASELSSASLLVIAGGKAAADAVRAAAASDGKLPRERVVSHVREKGKTAEFLLISR